jgi:hypothetical protein
LFRKAIVLLAVLFSFIGITGGMPCGSGFTAPPGTSEATTNGSARACLEGWRATSAAGPVRLRRVAGIRRPFAGRTGVELSRDTQGGRRAIAGESSSGSPFPTRPAGRPRRKSGCAVGELTLTGVYEMRGQWTQALTT